jgi:hypothetical protein
MPPTNSSNRLPELVRLLNEATERDRLVWEGTPDEDEFRAVLSTGMIRLARHENKMFVGTLPPEGPFGKYSLTVLDQRNQVIERLIPKDADELEMLGQLFGKVRRRVLNLDMSYESLLNELRRRADG